MTIKRKDDDAMTDRGMLLEIHTAVTEIRTEMKNLVTVPQMLTAFTECQEKHRSRLSYSPHGVSNGLQKKLIQALVLLITAAASALTTWAATQ